MSPSSSADLELGLGGDRDVGLGDERLDPRARDHRGGETLLRAETTTSAVGGPRLGLPALLHVIEPGMTPLFAPLPLGRPPVPSTAVGAPSRIGGPPPGTPDVPQRDHRPSLAIRASARAQLGRE